MSGKTFTLDQIREAADKKYGSTVIPLEGEEVELVNYLRLDKDARKALTEHTKRNLDEAEAEGDEDTTAEHFRQFIRLVARRRSQAEALIEEIGDDLGVLSTIVELYSDKTELGEASSSVD